MKAIEPTPRPAAFLPAIAAALGLVALLAAGCAGPRPRADAPADLPAAFPHHSLEQIQHHLASTSDTLHAFRARASLAIRSPKRSGQFGADLRSRRGDSLYMSLSPGLGIEAARALVTPDSFYVYDRLQNELTYGPVEKAGGVLPAALGSEHLFETLLGIVPPDPRLLWTVEADSAHYTLRSRDGLRLYVVDPARWRTVRYEERTPSGQLVEERVFSEFDRFGAVYLPRRVVLRRPLEEATASIYYRELDLNPSDLTFPLRVSDSAKRVLVR